MRMKQPSQDVSLNDGCGYLVESKRYHRHLQSSTESTQVSPSWVAPSHCWHLSFWSLDIILRQSQGCESGKCKSQRFGSYWRWGLCMCSSWMFSSTLSCWLPERREVRSTLSGLLPLLERHQADQHWLFHLPSSWPQLSGTKGVSDCLWCGLSVVNPLWQEG